MKRSYLILTYFYTPMISARAFRWGALAERWAAQGHEVDVIAGLEGDLLPHEQINGVNVYRVNYRLVEAIRRRSVPSHASMAQATTPGASPLRGIMTIARWAFYSVWANLYWPDAGLLWYWPALRKAGQLAAHKQYDALISVSPFFTAHLAAQHMDRRGIACWLADFGDPFSFQDIQPHNNAKLYGPLNRRVERRILDRADAVTVTTQPTSAIYARHFPETAGKISVIPPLLSITPTSQRNNSAETLPSRIKMVFAGMFYAQTRPPGFLLKLFAGLLRSPDLAERLELHLYGDISTVRASFDAYVDLIERGKIVLHGTVSREVVVGAMEDADILVNVGNKTAYQLPSKVIEYASTGKPILNLIQIDDDSSRAIYESYPAAITLLDQGGAYEDQVEILHQWITHLPPQVDVTFLQDWLSGYQLDAIAQAYDEVIDRASHHRG